jgi:transcriptional regulator GlxA family with amidase domain
MEAVMKQTPIFAALLVLTLAAGCRPSEPEKKSAAPTPATPPTATPAPTGDLAPATSDPVETPAQGTGLPAGRPLRAAFLVVDGVYNTELMAPYDVLQHTSAHAQPGIKVFTVSPSGGPVTTFEGLRITPQYGFRNAPPADILVVPSAKGSMDADLKNTVLVDWVRRTGSQARHVVSLCDGAFVLAQAGLLDGVPATTFPEDYERFARAFPRVDLRINVSFVDAGKFLTSQGGAQSYDVAMQLVDKLYGPKVAEGIGKGLLIPWPPNPRTRAPYAVIRQPAPAETTPAL